MISEGKCGSLKERGDEGNKEVMGWNMEGGSINGQILKRVQPGRVG